MRSTTPSSEDGQRPRILFVNHTAQLGGGEIALFNLIRHLDRSRFDVHVALLSNGPLAERLIAEGVETHVLDAGGVVDVRKDSLGAGSLLKISHAIATLRTAWRLSRFIRRNRFDIVHTNSLKADFIGGAAGRLALTPVIWHVRDRIADDYLPTRVAAAFRRLARILPKFVIANSQATLDTLNVPADNHRVAARYAVVHDGTPVGEWATPADVKTAREPVIGLVGRITPWKGQDVFLRAAAHVLQKFPQARFQVIGSPMFGEEAYEREVLGLAQSLGIADRVWFAGFRTDVVELIGRMDLLVHASVKAEPFGQVVIEGMCAGKAVIATAGGGVLEIVRHSETGLLVPMGDEQAMAAAMCDLLANPDRATAMGAAGRQRVYDHFSIALTAARVEAIYTNLLRRKTDSDRDQELVCAAQG